MYSCWEKSHEADSVEKKGSLNRKQNHQLVRENAVPKNMEDTLVSSSFVNTAKIAVRDSEPQTPVFQQKLIINYEKLGLTGIFPFAFLKTWSKLESSNEQEKEIKVSFSNWKYQLFTLNFLGNSTEELIFFNAYRYLLVEV